MSKLIDCTKRQIARASRDENTGWNDAVGFTARQAEKLLAVVEAAKIVSSGLHCDYALTPETWAKAKGELQDALVALEE
jgi:hypothetical protein